MGVRARGQKRGFFAKISIFVNIIFFLFSLTRQAGRQGGTYQTSQLFFIVFEVSDFFKSIKNYNFSLFYDKSDNHSYHWTVYVGGLSCQSITLFYHLTQMSVDVGVVDELLLSDHHGVLLVESHLVSPKGRLHHLLTCFFRPEADWPNLIGRHP